MSRWWVFAGATIATASAVGLVVAIRHLVRTNRASIVASVPLLREQQVQLPSAAKLVLYAEGPIASRAFAGVKFSLSRADAGDSVALEPMLARTKVSGVSRARVSLYSLRVSGGGEYVLRAQGLRSDSALDRHAVVFARDVRGTMLAAVLAIVITSIGFVGATVMAVIAEVFARRG